MAKRTSIIYWVLLSIEASWRIFLIRSKIAAKALLETSESFKPISLMKPTATSTESSVGFSRSKVRISSARISWQTCWLTKCATNLQAFRHRSFWFRRNERLFESLKLAMKSLTWKYSVWKKIALKVWDHWQRSNNLIFTNLKSLPKDENQTRENEFSNGRKLSVDNCHKCCVNIRKGWRSTLRLQNRSGEQTSSAHDVFGEELANDETNIRNIDFVDDTVNGFLQRFPRNSLVFDGAFVRNSCLHRLKLRRWNVSATCSVGQDVIFLIPRISRLSWVVYCCFFGFLWRLGSVPFGGRLGSALPSWRFGARLLLSLRRLFRFYDRYSRLWPTTLFWRLRATSGSSGFSSIIIARRRATRARGAARTTFTLSHI